MAHFTIYIFYASGAINLIVMLSVTALQIIGLIKNLYIRWFTKKAIKAKQHKKEIKEQAETSKK